METMWVINNETLRYMFDASEDVAQIAALMGVVVNCKDLAVSVKNDYHKQYVRKRTVMPYFDEDGCIRVRDVEFSDVKAPGEVKVIPTGMTCSGTIKFMELPMPRANAHDQVMEIFNKPGRHIFYLANEQPIVLQDVVMASWTAILTHDKKMIIVEDAMFVFRRPHIFETEAQIGKAKEGRGQRPSDDVR